MKQGGVDEGEDPRAAAIRELREETGVTSAEILMEVCLYPTKYYLNYFSFHSIFSIWYLNIIYPVLSHYQYHHDAVSTLVDI